MADNMENMLLNEDDSSSGESDTEVGVPAAAAKPSTAPPAAGAPTNPADMNARLKNLYSGAKAKAPSAAQPPQQHMSAPAQIRSHPQQQQRQKPPVQQQPPMQQQQHRRGSLGANSARSSSTGSSSHPSSRSMPGQPAVPPRSSSGGPGMPTIHHHNRPPPHHVGRSSSQQHPRMPAPHPSSSRVASDPFEPTPVAKIIERQQLKHQQHRRPPGSSATSATTSNTSGSNSSRGLSTAAMAASVSSSSEREDLIKKQKERFLMFTRVLMKYLENKDPKLHVKVKAIIKDCAERNKRQERGYESVSASMRARLKEVVSDSYWQRAEAYLDHVLQQRKQQEEARRAAANDPRRSQGSTKMASARGGAPSKSSVKGSSTTVASQLQEISEKRQKLAGSGPTSKTYTKPTKAPSTSPKQQQQQQQQQRKATSMRPKTTDSSATTTPLAEHREFMERIEHAVDFDWTTAGLTLGRGMQMAMSDEQHKLLYSKRAATSPNVLVPSFPHHRWGVLNVVSARTAWARLRLREQRYALKDDPNKGNLAKNLRWLNEDHAEDDKTLAVLSEGAQLYLKSVLVKAVHCARQRQNVDGIRLYHQQQQAQGNPTTKPSLSLRLGCDVSRQVAQSQGNAALTCKRMEEALERQKRREFGDDLVETFQASSSMADLAMRVPLAHAVEEANGHAKRSFAVMGTASKEPMGRLEKRARLVVQDFEMGQHFGATRAGRQRASTTSFMF